MTSQHRPHQISDLFLISTIKKTDMLVQCASTAYQLHELSAKIDLKFDLTIFLFHGFCREEDQVQPLIECLILRLIRTESFTLFRL